MARQGLLRDTAPEAPAQPEVVTVTTVYGATVEVDADEAAVLAREGLLTAEPGPAAPATAEPVVTPDAPAPTATAPVPPVPVPAAAVPAPAVPAPAAPAPVVPPTPAP